MKHSGLSDADLVIFGCGYLGSALAEIAVKLGLRVHAVTRNRKTAKLLRKRGVATFEGLLEDGGWQGSVPSAPAFAVNCIGASLPTTEGYRRSYVEGMDAIGRWAASGPPGVFVYTSSTGVYGEAAGDVNEDTAPGALTEKNRILRDAERLVAGGCFARRWFILRLSGLYGPGRHQWLDRARSGELTPGGEVDRRMNIIHRDDACRAILDCLDAAPEIASQVFNVTSDVASGRLEMIQWMLRHVSSDRGNTAAIESDSQRTVPDRVVSNCRIREVLGWRPLYPDFRAGYEAILNQIDR